MTLVLSPCVIDASVGIKLFLQEEQSEDVQEIFDSYLDESVPASLCTPDLFFVECANILRSKVRFSGYPPQTAIQAMTYLRALAIPATSTADLVEDALAITCTHEITAYDAVYVALAARKSLPLLTADDRLIRKLQGSAYQLLNIGDYLTSLT